MSKTKPRPDRASVTVTFHNVTITMKAPSARQAYDDLRKLLDRYRGSRDIDWETDTYSIDGGEEPRDTSELFPE